MEVVTSFSSIGNKKRHELIERGYMPHGMYFVNEDGCGVILDYFGRVQWLQTDTDYARDDEREG